MSSQVFEAEMHFVCTTNIGSAFFNICEYFEIMYSPFTNRCGNIYKNKGQSDDKRQSSFRTLK